jgi:hypothetical protein
MKKDDKETSDLDLFVSDKEWDLWLLDREQWKKELSTFALRSAKDDVVKPKMVKKGKKK